MTRTKVEDGYVVTMAFSNAENDWVEICRRKLKKGEIVVSQSLAVEPTVMVDYRHTRKGKGNTT